MIALKIVITFILFQAAFAQPPVPEDAPCPDDENNCANNSYCYIYSVTGQPYCAQSCELNNGGCGTDQCEMVTVQCFTDPCPPVVQCIPATTRSPSGDDAPCSDDQNNCANTSYCYIYSVTGRPYCAQSCELNNGGCGTGRCEMITVQCFTDPCPPIVQCTPATEVCELPPVVGDCDAAFLRYFFNSTSQRCETFTYGGCGGNANNFAEEADCVRTCRPGPYTCTFQPVSGACLAYFPSYFYNVTSRSCQMFVYGGCGGNDNRFRTAAECDTICSTSIDFCGLDPEPGVCDAYFPSYFYNMTSKRCEMFVYGGCGGNANRFSTVEQCEGTCASDMCALQPEVGNCRGSFTRYFYNKLTRRCEWFTYGGCGGNANNFVNERDCIRTCQPGTTIAPTRTSTVTMMPTPTATPGPYTCRLQPESGVCLAAFRNYFYNVNTRSCQVFTYGGCGGNDNRFNTAEECDTMCSTNTNFCGLDPETGLCEAYIPSYFYNVTSKRCEMFVYGGCGGNDNRFSTLEQCEATCADDVCALQPEVGNCRGSFTRYFYNKLTRRCELFSYGGCGGNANNFVNERDCIRTCQPGTTIAPTHTSTVTVIPTPTTTPDPYTCSLQPESGLCLAAFQSYFYNVTTRSCQVFTYGGCGGNENRFRTMAECYTTCSRSNNFCGLDPVTGVCEAYIPSYFYNTTSKQCEKFIYGGCRGNRNRFSTLDECQATCDIDVCTLQPEPGFCRGSFARYFYNKFTRKCEKFIYGGCGGNGNRFSDMRSCEEACVSSVPRPSPVVPKKSIVTITIDSFDGDLDAFVVDFTDELTQILMDSGIDDAAIQVVDISYTPDDGVVLSVAVYSDSAVVSGDEIAALINQNKDTFSVAVSDAVVEEDSTSGGVNSAGGRAVAGIVIGIIAGLMQT